MSLFYRLNAIGLTKRHANEIVKFICNEPYDFILLKSSAEPGETAAAMHFKNYLSVQALDEIKKTGATIIINYKKIRQDLDENIKRHGELSALPPAPGKIGLF
ncbi:MAG: hypothetical protein KQI81_23510 [Deltaproteobacteria bacterium]|nr:hypothetical protein [Deltaproteobacteria bacterium]